MSFDGLDHHIWNLQDGLAGYIRTQESNQQIHSIWLTIDALELRKKTTKLSTLLNLFSESEAPQLSNMLNSVSFHLKELDTS